jgi:glycosyltransferase involved in cell wall biosynthesis
VPTCGRPALLLRCLQGLLAQTHPADDFEVIVVDDAHHEATRRLVMQLAEQTAAPPIRYLRPRGRGAAQGPAVARNAGWQAAHGEIIAFTDDDTVPLADWLAEGAAALQPPWVAMAGRVLVPRSHSCPR